MDPVSLVALLWGILYYVQLLLNYGTAYRLTKHGGDNGVALFGWMVAMSFASVIPGLGIYLWYRYRQDTDKDSKNDSARTNGNENSSMTDKSVTVNSVTSEQSKRCNECGAVLPEDGCYCESCGAKTN